jgi:flavin reductase (DIM6/NTAB) family NADH-FMN oxidoreductase RutF
MEKISVGANVFTFPMPVALLGCMVDGRANFMALGWMTRVNANPPLIGVGVGNHHHTTKGLRESKAFSINYPGADMRVVTDYCGIVSGKSEDKSAAFTVFYGLLGATCQ